MIIESKIIAYLKAKKIVGNNVYAERPQTLPKKYILIEKTGSSEHNHITRATVAIQSIASASLLTAAELNEQVKEAIEAMPDTVDIFKAQLNSDYNFTDTTTKEYRYQAVFDFYY